MVLGDLVAWELGLVTGAFALGALLKGVTGLGLPPVVLPVLALFFGVEHAIVVLAIPNVVSNVVMVLATRSARGQVPWLGRLAGAAAIGGALGAYLLTGLDDQVVALTLALLVTVWIGLRLWRPDQLLTSGAARRTAVPVGLIGGVLQGATGLSSPVIVSWGQSTGLPREPFVLMTTVFFLSATLLQAVTFVGLGAVAGERWVHAVVGCATVLGVLPVGQRLGRRLSARGFEQVVLIVLAGAAMIMVVEALV